MPVVSFFCPRMGIPSLTRDRIHRAPCSNAERNMTRPDHRCKKFNFSYPTPGPRRKEKIEFLVENRNTTGSWATLRNPAGIIIRNPTMKDDSGLTRTIRILDQLRISHNAKKNCHCVSHQQDNYSRLGVMRTSLNIDETDLGRG